MQFYQASHAIVFILILCAVLPSIKGQATQSPSYSCHENNSDVTFTLSSLSHSARQTSSNCSLSECNISSGGNNSCRSSSTPCFDYRTLNNTSYCAPGIFCSILSPCNNITYDCASNTSVCIINSCCSPQPVCLPLFLTTFCNSSNDTSNSTGWSITGNLNNARALHTASVLTNGKVLVAGGYNYNITLDSAELYDPSTGNWMITGNMSTDRSVHTASILTNGKVLVTGGFNNNNNFTYINSSELYDPSTGMWTLSGMMNLARSYHTASLLANGTVLVAGGLDFMFNASTAELYDPLTGMWTMTGSLNSSRYYHTASVLANGKVLVAGGLGIYIAFNIIAELYDPSTGNWTITGSMNIGRFFHTASILMNGKVLVTGGYTFNTTLNSAELYDPSTGNWTTTGSMNNGRYYHTASVLTNGKVLVAGGFYGNTTLNSSELYDPLTETWTITDSMNNARTGHTASILTSGKVLMTGGANSFEVLNTAELYS